MSLELYVITRQLEILMEWGYEVILMNILLFIPSPFSLGCCYLSIIVYSGLFSFQKEAEKG